MRRSQTEGRCCPGSCLQPERADCSRRVLGPFQAELPGAAALPPRPARAWMPPRRILAHPPSQPRLLGNSLMPVIAPLATRWPRTSSPGAVNGKRQDACALPQGFCSRLPLSQLNPRPPHGGRWAPLCVFKVTQQGRHIRDSGFSLQAWGR